MASIDGFRNWCGSIKKMGNRPCVQANCCGIMLEHGQEDVWEKLTV